MGIRDTDVAGAGLMNAVWGVALACLASIAPTSDAPAQTASRRPCLIGLDHIPSVEFRVRDLEAARRFLDGNEALARPSAAHGLWLRFDEKMSAVAQETVTFATSDGGAVSADSYGDGDRAVVLAPGGRFTKSSWEAQAHTLAEAGFRVLAIDFRGRGDSRAGSAGADALELDVLAAVRYLRGAGARTVALVGASLGGWAAGNALVASEPGEIDRIVLLAHSPIEHPEKLTGRKLFILGRHDTRGEGIPRLPEVRDQYERAPEPKKLVVLEGSAHAQLLFETEEGEQLMAEILRFLSQP